MIITISSILITLLLGYAAKRQVARRAKSTPKNNKWFSLSEMTSRVQFFFRNLIPSMWLLAILAGIATFHWLFWAAKPQAWNTWYQSELFLPMNLAIILALFLISQRGGMTKFIGWSLATSVLVFGIIAHKPKAPSGSELEKASAQQPAPMRMGRLSADIALPIVAQCESGGRQFGKDGQVLTNTNTNGSIDKGMWQINSQHWADAAGLGIDLDTEEGNRKYAGILYGRNELSDWQATRHCWEPILMAWGGVLPKKPASFVIVAERDKWTEIYRYPPNMTVDYRAVRPDGRFGMKIQDGSIYHFSPEKSDVVPGVISSASYLAEGDSPEKIRISLY